MMSHSRFTEPDTSRRLPEFIRTSLSEEQLRPFLRSTANAAVLASAGSGKTRMLVGLVLNDLIQGVSPTGIVAFTFTEKAGAEILARVHKQATDAGIAQSLEGIFLGTIHSWCLQHLLSKPDYADLTVLDEMQLEFMVNRLHDYLRLDAVYRTSYPRGTARFLTDLEVVYNENVSLSELPIAIRPSVSQFFAFLRANRLTTFGGLVRSTIEDLRLRGPVTTLERLYVDEYQDVNPAQVDLLRAMRSATTPTVVVGDELQCIYNWRGSDVSQILSFSESFGDTTVVRLHQNFRSRPDIVTVCNKVATHISTRDTHKSMYPTRVSCDGPAVHHLIIKDDQTQALAVAAVADTLIRNGLRPRDIAILLRSVTSWGEPIRSALGSLNIPVHCPVLGRGSLFASQFLLPLFDWLQREPKEPRNGNEEALLEAKAEHLWQAVRVRLNPHIDQSEFWQRLEAWQNSIDNITDSSYDIRGELYRLLAACGFRIEPTDDDLIAGVSLASQLIRAVEEVHRRRLQELERLQPRRVMSEVCFALSYRHGQYGETTSVEAVSDAVTLTTVHQAKGLEWPVVIVPMLRTSRFPLRSQPFRSSFPPAMVARYGTAEEDELRLFYVAITRARERLFLLSPTSTQDHSTPRFLTGLPLVIHRDSQPWKSPEDPVWNVTCDASDHQPPLVTLGLSDVLLYIECPYQYGLRRVAHLQPAIGEELGYGLGLHNVIRARLTEGTHWPPKTVQSRVSQHIALPYVSQEKEASARLEVCQYIEGLQSLHLFEVGCEPEVSVSLVFDDGVVNGTVDGVIAMPDGKVALRDWKTNVHGPYVQRYRRQLQFYAAALRRQGRTVIEASILDIAASCMRGSPVVHRVDISDTAVRRLCARMSNALSAIRNRTHPIAPEDGACQICDVALLCAERRDHHDNADRT